ncbi:MAG: hypothetical protein MJ059_05315 [Lachnospiraceae bacterium]|nr:hypothetical protein [Lachnospiraceae bacterium]
MSGLEKRTVLLNTLNNFGAVLVSLFISVYLFVYTNSIPVMCLQVIARIAMFPFFFSLAYKVSLKAKLAVTYTIGLVFITLSLVYTLMIGERFATRPLLVVVQAMIYGSGEGFYWYSANTSNQIVPTRESRNVFLSYNGIFCNVAGILAPVFSTVVLSMYQSETEGYRMILLCITAIFVLVSFVAFSINKRVEDAEDCLRETFRLGRTDRRVRDLHTSYFIYGLVNGMSLGLINLLIFRAAGSGSTYSKLQIFFALVTVSGFSLIRYLFAWGRLNATFKIGAFLRVAAILVLVIFPSVSGAIVHGVLFAASNVFFDNCVAFISGYVLDDYPRQKSALVVTREVMLSFGRIASMGVMLLFYRILPGDLYLTVAPVILSLAAILTERKMIKCMK